MKAQDIEYKSGLIRTKYSRPGISSNMVHRNRLYDRLNKALDHKLTIVTAPAGYGKSVAVNEWLNFSGVPFAWVSIDESDNDPVIFGKYICAALDVIVRDISLEASYAFSSQELLNSNIHLSILIDRLSDATSDFVLVLDDFHYITDKRILKNLSYLISFLPHKMHIVIISRTEPDLKLAKHGIKGDLTILRSNSLQFQQEEIAEFYKVRGFYLTGEAVRRIERYTEGWAAALVAVAMSMEEEEDQDTVINGLASCDKRIYRYLQDEVISLWPEENRGFILKTSILDMLCGPLCDAVTVNGSGSRILEILKKRNGFLISLDNDNIWYRYHYIFKEFLDKLLTESNINRKELSYKAAEWYECNGYLNKAIEYYLQAEYYEKAMTLITTQIKELIQSGEYYTILKWMDRLPEKYRDNSFVIASLHTFYYTEMNLLDDAWKSVDKMERIVSGNKEIEQVFNFENKQLIELCKANIALRQGNFEMLGAIIERASQIAKEKSVKMSDYIECNFSDIYLYRSSTNKLVKLAGEDSECFHRFVSNYRAMLPKAPGYAPLAEGEYYYEINRFTDAIPCLLSAMNEAIDAGCPGALIPAVATIARIKRAQGDPDGALAAVQEHEGWLRKQGKPHWIYLLNAFKTRLYVDSGDMEKADKWFTSCKLGIYHEISRTKEFELITYARVLIEKGQLNDADILLKRLLIFVEGAARLHSEVEILNLLAVAAAKMGNEEHSMSCLEKALKIGSDEGYMRSFADELASMWHLLKMYIRLRGKQNELAIYAGKLFKLEAYSAKVTKLAKGGSRYLTTLLTPQENKVLQLLAFGRSNIEIAEELGIALSTVKYHNVNLFGKLEAKTRLEAINRARMLGLLD